MQIIDLDDLGHVTGGTQAPQDPSAQAGAGAGGAPQGAAPGGGFLAGLQQFFGFLQSPQFQQFIGSIQGLIGSISGQGGAAPAGGQPAARQPGQQPTAQ